MAGIPQFGDRPGPPDSPGATPLCVVRIEHFASGRVLVTVSTSVDIATTELTVAGRRNSGTEALALVADFLRRYGQPGQPPGSRSTTMIS